MRTLLVLFILLLAFSCATVEQKERYQLVHDFIVAEHDKAMFGPEASYVTPQDLRLDGITPGTLREIQEKYFAVTKDRIGLECTEHYLACKDPLAFEYVVRKVHNSEILASKESKLKTLDSWAKGETSDDELLRTLGWEAWPGAQPRSPGNSPALARRP